MTSLRTSERQRQLSLTIRVKARGIIIIDACIKRLTQDQIAVGKSRWMRQRPKGRFVTIKFCFPVSFFPKQLIL